MADEATTNTVVDEPTPVVLVNVEYCPVCTLPYEYCSYGPKAKRCKALLYKTDLQKFAQVYPEDINTTVPSVTDDTEGFELVEPTGDLTVNEDLAEELANVDLDAPDKKASSKKAAAAAASAGIIEIKPILRSKKKSTTSVVGLQQYNVDLKKAAKLFAGRFACGSSAMKNAAGVEDTISIQGDFQMEVRDIILKNWPQIPEDKIMLLEAKKKKSSE